MNIDNMSEFGDMSCNAFIDMLLSLNPYDLTTLAFSIGMILAPTVTISQQYSLGNFFELIGQTLVTINAQESYLQPSSPSRLELNEKIKKLEKELNNLKRNLNNP